MELLLCPNCGGFVRRDWDNCRACGAELTEVDDGLTAPAPTATEEVQVEELPVEPAADETAEQQPEQQIGAEESTPSDEEPIVVDTADATEQSPLVNTDSAPTSDAPTEGPATDVTPDLDPPSDSPIETDNEDTTSLLPSKKVIVVAVISVLVLVAAFLVATVNMSDSKPSDAPAQNSAPAENEKWSRYVDPQKRFAVDVPTPPAVEEQTVDGRPRTETRTDLVGLRARMIVRVTKSNGDFPKEDQYLKDSLNRYASSTSGKVETQNIARIGDRRQLDATLTAGNTRSSYRTWVKGDQQFEVLVTTNDGKADPALFIRFADSLVAPAP